MTDKNLNYASSYPKFKIGGHYVRVPADSADNARRLFVDKMIEAGLNPRVAFLNAFGFFDEKPMQQFLDDADVQNLLAEYQQHAAKGKHQIDLDWITKNALAIYNRSMGSTVANQKFDGHAALKAIDFLQKLHGIKIGGAGTEEDVGVLAVPGLANADNWQDLVTRAEEYRQVMIDKLGLIPPDNDENSDTSTPKKKGVSKVIERG